jgi:hypothetical protein
MREAGEIIHGGNRVRFETDRALTNLQWRTVNASMRLTLKFLASVRREAAPGEGELGPSPPSTRGPDSAFTPLLPRDSVCSGSPRDPLHSSETHTKPLPHDGLVREETKNRVCREAGRGDPSQCKPFLERAGGPGGLNGISTPAHHPPEVRE